MNKQKPVKRKPRRNAVKSHSLPVELRKGNFNEVNLGYVKQSECFVEANRCLSCRRSNCSYACPANFDIPTMMNFVKEGDFQLAADVVNSFYCIPQSLNRICPAFCQDACLTGKKGDPIQILNIKRYLSDNYAKPVDFYDTFPLTGKMVAVIGAGPAGLTAAFELAKLGNEVTIYEKTKIGGMLSLGIPEYRLKHKMLLNEVKQLERLGIKFCMGKEYGKDIDYLSLNASGFDAILIAHGAHKPKWMGIPGEKLKGSIHAIDFLREVALGKKMDLGKKVCVVGGGDVAIDAVRVAHRLNSEAFIVYRRSREEMPATKGEIFETEEEKIPINYLTNPVEIIGEDGEVKAVKLVKMELGEPDESGRRRPSPIPNSEYIVEIDTIIQAISQKPEHIIFEKEGFILSKWHNFEVDNNTLSTNVFGVFAAGDNVSGPATAIEAIKMGKKVAIAIDAFLLDKEKTEISIVQR